MHRTVTYRTPLLQWCTTFRVWWALTAPGPQPHLEGIEGQAARRPRESCQPTTRRLNTSVTKAA